MQTLYHTVSGWVIRGCSDCIRSDWPERVQAFGVRVQAFGVRVRAGIDSTRAGASVSLQSGIKKIAGLRAPVRRKSINLRIVFFWHSLNLSHFTVGIWF